MKNKINIVLADDHTIIRDGIKYLLEEENDLIIIGEASNGIEALEIVKEKQPDILIIDVRMPKMNGIEAVKILNSKTTKTKAIVLSMHDSEEYILEAIEAKAMGYLLKDAGKEEVLKAIHTVYHGEKFFSGDISNIIVNNLLKKSSSIDREEEGLIKNSQINLTKKEIEILKLILFGKTNKQISEKLFKSKRTIETHRFNLMKKMKVKNLIELATEAAKYNF
ncbi:MAG: response regulator transcription factor [Cyclobacteriaceae bacterium]|nr:response regulator transcription factor [Cyclobacteriaceae bacterium]